MARKNGQNHDIESIYEPNIKSARYGEQEERVLARIIAKIKESRGRFFTERLNCEVEDGDERLRAS